MRAADVHAWRLFPDPFPGVLRAVTASCNDASAIGSDAPEATPLRGSEKSQRLRLQNLG